MIYSIFSFLLPELFSFVGKRLIGKKEKGNRENLFVFSNNIKIS